MVMKIRTGQVDIETAFLYSDLDKAIYMRIPDGYVRYMKEVHNKNIDPTTHVLLLKMAINGLVRAARQWWKQFKEVMAGCNYYPTKADSWWR
jgi:hypothetical protein